MDAMRQMDDYYVYDFAGILMPFTEQLTLITLEEGKGP